MRYFSKVDDIIYSNPMEKPSEVFEIYTLHFSFAIHTYTPPAPHEFNPNRNSGNSCSSARGSSDGILVCLFKLYVTSVHKS